MPPLSTEVKPEVSLGIVFVILSCGYPGHNHQFSLTISLNEFWQSRAQLDKGGSLPCDVHGLSVKKMDVLISNGFVRRTHAYDLN